MSKIGKNPIIIPEDITVILTDDGISVKNKKGEEMLVPNLTGIKPVLKDKELRFELLNKTKQSRSNWGTFRALTQNAIVGLVSGFEKTLILEGVGFKITKDGEGLQLNLGFSHPIKYPAVPGIVFELEKNSTLKIKGVDKILVGHTAAGIRALRKPEPYKGKGFRYIDEVIRRKAGKKSVGSGG